MNGQLAGGRDATDPAEGHSQTDFYVQLRSVPAPWLYLSGRYRIRERNYSGAPVGHRNSDRSDTRRQLTLLAVVQTHALFAWEIYYAVQDAVSTVTSRTFTNQQLSAGVSVRF